MSDRAFAALLAHLTAMAELGGGLWHMTVTRSADATRLFIAAEQGNAIASASLIAAGSAITQLQAEPTPCLLCDATCGSENGAGAVLTLFADGVEAGRSVSHVLCRQCAAASNATLRTAAVDWYRRYGLLTNPRELPPFAPAGHA